jgi:hypothetical protein
VAFAGLEHGEVVQAATPQRNTFQANWSVAILIGGSAVTGVKAPIRTMLYSVACTPTDPAAFFNTPAQMAVLANELGGAILMGHSQSSGFPTMAALQPGSHGVKGIIQLETGCFGNLTSAEITTLSKIPMLIEYGDFSPVTQPAAPCPTEIQQITNAGGDIKFAWLPALSPGSLYSGSPGPITGNEHMVMLDNNNLQIAQILIDWATSRGL